MQETDKARAARIRIDAARKHLTDAIEALSGPEPDWVRCSAFIDMAGDVLPYIREGEPIGTGALAEE